MCIKIIKTHEEIEFEPSQPLEQQVRGARQIIINYDPSDDRIQSFMDQMDRIVKTGIGCQMNIKVNSNNSLKSYQFERQMDEATKNLELNEAISMIVKNQSETDKKLEDMQQMCLRGIE